MAIRENYSHSKADAKNTKRRNEAIVRQQKRDKRTNKEQLTVLDKQGRIAKKERARLNKV